MLVIALAAMLVDQHRQLREATSRERQLREALAGAETRAAWEASVAQWRGIAASRSIQERWAEGLSQASIPGQP